MDNSEERINFGNTRTFILSWDWKLLNESDSGTIFELYNDSGKANKGLNSFYVTYGDGHTYVCRFDCALKRKGNSVNRYGINRGSLKNTRQKGGCLMETFDARQLACIASPTKTIWWKFHIVDNLSNNYYWSIQGCS